MRKRKNLVTMVNFKSNFKTSEKNKEIFLRLGQQIEFRTWKSNRKR